MKISVNKWEFDYPHNTREASSFNKRNKKYFQDNIKGLKLIPKFLCKLGFCNRTHKKEFKAWVIENDVCYCNRCGKLHWASSQWNSD